MKLLFREDNVFKITEVDNAESLSKAISYVDFRQRFNAYRKIELYKVNFDNVDDKDIIIRVFKTSRKQRRDELFIKLDMKTVVKIARGEKIC